VKELHSPLLNVHSFSDARQTEIDTAEPSLPEPNPSEVEIAILRLKNSKSPGSEEMPEKLLQARGEIRVLLSAIHELINSIWNEEKLPHQFTKRLTKLTVIIIVGYHCYQFHSKFSNTLLSKLSPYIDKIIGDHQCAFRRNRSNFLHSSYTGEKYGSTIKLYITYK
jgi:hypothetical protein